MRSKQKMTPGDLVQISLGDGHSAYGRVLERSEVAFYNFFANADRNVDLESIYVQPIAFVLPVMNSAIKQGRWRVVDHRPLESILLTARHYVIKDKVSGRLSIYESAGGTMRDATVEECKGLEAAAVWEPEHVEDRLRDLLAGRDNRWAEQLKPRS